MFPMSNPICFRISSPATVASAPVSGVACAVVMKLSSANLTHCGRHSFVLTATRSPMTHFLQIEHSLHRAGHSSRVL